MAPTLRRSGPLKSLNVDLGSTVRDASTVIIAREGARSPIEVFLSRRTAKAAFMANAYVYPGGALDVADVADDLVARVDGEDPVSEFEDRVSAPRAAGLFVAAIRECFEEAGVLFARRRDGTAVDLSEAETAARFKRHREALNHGAVDWTSIVRAEDLVLESRQLHYMSHWITPPLESRRFDTRFFFAVLPPGQTPAPDYRELVHGDWFTPRDALAASERGEMLLAPPTICTLIELSEQQD